MTTQHAQRPKARAATEQETTPEAADKRNAELAEDVACCLAEIDELLTETEEERQKTLKAERKAAIAAWRKFRRATNYDEQAEAFNQKYAHLHIKADWSCCIGAYLYDTETDEMLG